MIVITRIKLYEYNIDYIFYSKQDSLQKSVTLPFFKIRSTIK